MQQQPDTLLSVVHQLSDGATSSLALVRDCLARVQDGNGQGSIIYLETYSDEALDMARHYDRLRARGDDIPLFAGIPISIKDNFDVAHSCNRAGSILSRFGCSAATADAASVCKLRQAGFILLGRTNMTELALSSIGANPHHGTPLSIWDRATQRIPGGSSAGAALSVADRMAYAAIGSDTGGSCRIPAAFNHLVGFRPSQRRISTRGVMPFSHSMDTVGPLSRTVDCCAALDSVLSDEPPYELRRDLLGVSIGVPDGLVLEGLDVHVGQAFEDALSVMRRAGADLQEIDAPEFKEIFDTNAYADLGVYEVFQIYREVAEQCSAKMDPRIRNRILTGSGKTAAQYARLLQQRNRLMQACSIRFANLDAIMFPTVPIVPPPISGIADDNDYLYYNKLLLRNTSLISFIDGCSITVPISREPDPPVGLMFSGVNGSDRKVMSVAAGFESVFSALLH